MKVIDFGLASPTLKSKVFLSQLQDFTVGTPQYMAPELFDTSHDDISKIDVWALAIVLINMITGLKFPLPLIHEISDDLELTSLL